MLCSSPQLLSCIWERSFANSPATGEGSLANPPLIAPLLPSAKAKSEVLRLKSLFRHGIRSLKTCLASGFCSRNKRWMCWKLQLGGSPGHVCRWIWLCLGQLRAQSVQHCCSQAVLGAGTSLEECCSLTLRVSLAFDQVPQVQAIPNTSSTRSVPLASLCPPTPAVVCSASPNTIPP